jgi:hypothetical protein
VAQADNSHANNSNKNLSGLPIKSCPMAPATWRSSTDQGGGQRRGAGVKIADIDQCAELAGSGQGGQLGNVHRNPARFIFREQLAAFYSSSIIIATWRPGV